MGRQARRLAQDTARQGRGRREAGAPLRSRRRDLQGTGGAAAGVLRRGRIVVRGAARRGCPGRGRRGGGGGGAEQPAGGQAAGAEKKDNVVDADYEIVDDDNKKK